MTLRFTEEQIADMRLRRKAGQGWNTIALFYNVNAHVIRRNLDPLWKVRRNNAALDYYRRRRDGFKLGRMPGKQYHFPDMTTRAEVPEECWEELRQALKGNRTLTQEFCGDPLPGRSALDRRSGSVNA